MFGGRILQNSIGLVFEYEPSVILLFADLLWFDTAFIYNSVPISLE